MIFIPYVQKLLGLAGKCAARLAARLARVAVTGILLGILCAFCIKGCGVTLELMNERPLLKKVQ